MDMKRCPNGHFYDASLYTTCPYCQGASANVNLNMGRPPQGIPGQPQGMFAQAPGMSGQPPRNVGATMPVRPEDGSGPAGPEKPERGQKTVAVIEQKTGINPVVGWMVCVDGEGRGKDYHLHGGNNFIGRNPSMDICLERDKAVSRENHGTISYDDRHKAYYAAPGTGQNIIYLNGKPLLMIQELKAYDRLEVGNTTLMFIPLCGEEFQWEKE